MQQLTQSAILISLNCEVMQLPKLISTTAGIKTEYDVNNVNKVNRLCFNILAYITDVSTNDT